VKTTWIKLFPEEALEDKDNDADHEEEVFPTNVAFPAVEHSRPSRDFTATKTDQLNFDPANTSSSVNVNKTLDSKAASTATATAVAKQGILALDDSILNTNKMSSTDISRHSSSEHNPLLLRTNSSSLHTKKPAYSTINVEPLSRTSLMRPPQKPPGGNLLIRRQLTEAINAKYISPITQQFLGSTDPGVGTGNQKMTRTVPVGWCLTGGSDTHRKHPVDQNLHDSLRRKGKRLIKLEKIEKVKNNVDRYKAVKLIESNCKEILSGGANVVGHYSRDIVNRRKGTHGKDAPAALLQPQAKAEDDLLGFKLDDLLKEDDLEDCLA
jgi:hypothetical protein